MTNIFIYIRAHKNIKITKKSFSIIELSISIVIISIVLSVILFGKQLITSSKTNSFYQDFMYYKKAITSFYNLYDALPGDVSIQQLNGSGAEKAIYRYNQGDPSTSLGTNFTAINDGIVTGCDSRDGFRQMLLAGLIGGKTGLTSNQNIATPAQCSLLTNTAPINTAQTLDISNDVGVSLPFSSSDKTIGIHYATVPQIIIDPNVVIYGPNLNPGDIVITLFGAKGASYYANINSLFGINSAIALNNLQILSTTVATSNAQYYQAMLSAYKEQQYISPSSLQAIISNNLTAYQTALATDPRQYLESTQLAALNYQAAYSAPYNMDYYNGAPANLGTLTSNALANYNTAFANNPNSSATSIGYQQYAALTIANQMKNNTTSSTASNNLATMLSNYNIAYNANSGSLATQIAYADYVGALMTSNYLAIQNINGAPSYWTGQAATAYNNYIAAYSINPNSLATVSALAIYSAAYYAYDLCYAASLAWPPTIASMNTITSIANSTSASVSSLQNTTACYNNNCNCQSGNLGSNSGCSCSNIQCYCSDPTICGCSGGYCFIFPNIPPHPLTVNSLPSFASLPSSLAQKIDIKFDDGLPLTGQILGTKGWDKTSGSFGGSNNAIDSTWCNNATTALVSNPSSITYVNSNKVGKTGCLLSFNFLASS